jgi:hypothetical protein
MEDESLTITLQQVYQEHFEMMRLMYFDYMITCKDGSFQDFIDFHLTHVKEMLFALNNVYADHLEGTRKDFIEMQSRKNNAKGNGPDTETSIANS